MTTGLATYQNDLRRSGGQLGNEGLNLVVVSKYLNFFKGLFLKNIFDLLEKYFKLLWCLFICAITNKLTVRDKGR